MNPIRLSRIKQLLKQKQHLMPLKKYEKQSSYVAKYRKLYEEAKLKLEELKMEREKCFVQLFREYEEDIRQTQAPPGENAIEES